MLSGWRGGPGSSTLWALWLLLRRLHAAQPLGILCPGRWSSLAAFLRRQAGTPADGLAVRALCSAPSLLGSLVLPEWGQWRGMEKKTFNVLKFRKTYRYCTSPIQLQGPTLRWQDAEGQVFFSFPDLLLFPWFQRWETCSFPCCKNFPYVLTCALLCSAHDPHSKFWFIRKSSHTSLFLSFSKEKKKKRMAFANKRCLLQEYHHLAIDVKNLKAQSQMMTLGHLFPRRNGCYWFNELEDSRDKEELGITSNLDTYFTISKICAMCISSPNTQFRRITLYEAVV